MKLSQLALSYGLAGRLMLAIIPYFLQHGHIVSTGVLKPAIRVMHHTSRRLSLRNRPFQWSDRQMPAGHHVIPGPTHNLPWKPIQNHGQVDNLTFLGAGR